MKTKYTHIFQGAVIMAVIIGGIFMYQQDDTTFYVYAGLSAIYCLMCFFDD